MDQKIFYSELNLGKSRNISESVQTILVTTKKNPGFLGIVGLKELTKESMYRHEGSNSN